MFGTSLRRKRADTFVRYLNEIRKDRPELSLCDARREYSKER